MRGVGYTSTKLHFANSWVHKPLKYTPLSVYVRDAFRISTWSLSRGLCFQVRNSWHSLFFCWRLANSVALLQAPPSGLRVNWKWKWRDIRPSMVTHTRNLCSAINPSKVHTHSSEHTHTPWTHTWSSGQLFMLWRLGSGWGFSAFLKGTSVVVFRVERALYIHSPHLQFLPAQDSNSQPLDYESDSLTIRPRLPLIRCKASCTEPRCPYHDGSVRIHVSCHPYCLQ